APPPKNACPPATSLLAQPLETAETRSLRDEANRLGEASDRIYGVRNTGYFNLDRDFVGLEWLKGQVAALAPSTDPDRLRTLVKELVDYEDPGPGGFHDDAGAPGRQPHLTLGTTRSGT